MRARGPVLRCVGRRVGRPGRAGIERRSQGTRGGHDRQDDHGPDEQPDGRVDARARDERRRDEEAQLVEDALEMGPVGRVRHRDRTGREHTGALAPRGPGGERDRGQQGAKAQEAPRPVARGDGGDGGEAQEDDEGVPVREQHAGR